MDIINQVIINILEDQMGDGGLDDELEFAEMEKEDDINVKLNKKDKDEEKDFVTQEKESELAKKLPLRELMKKSLNKKV